MNIRACFFKCLYKEASGKYDHINFKPPEGVAAAAKRGLELRRKNNGKGGLSSSKAKKEGVGSGVQRAVNLSNRNNLSPSTVRRMKAFFDRHEKNIKVDPGKKPSEDRGYIAGLLWGGSPGKSWANKIVNQMNAADKKSKKKAAIKALMLKFAEVEFSPKMVDQFLQKCVQLDCSDLTFEELLHVCDKLNDLHAGRFDNFVKLGLYIYNKVKEVSQYDDRFDKFESMTIRHFADLMDSEIYQDVKTAIIQSNKICKISKINTKKAEEIDPQKVLYKLTEEIILNRYEGNVPGMIEGLFRLKDLALHGTYVGLPKDKLSPVFVDFLSHSDMWDYLKDMKIRFEQSGKLTSQDRDAVHFIMSDLENIIAKKALFGEVDDDSDDVLYEIPEEFMVDYEES